MKHKDAVALIRDAVGHAGGTWADLGCGTGTFTRALVDVLAPKSRIFAIDRDANALDELARWSKRHAVGILTLCADFTEPSVLAGVAEPSLDGILLANSLHFVREADSVLAGLVHAVRPPAHGGPGGRVLLVEYDRRDANRWVPYPIPRDRLAALARSAGLSAPVTTATRPSEYQGLMYAAWAERV